MFNPVPEPVSGTRPGLAPEPGPLFRGHGGEGARAACAAAGAARPFPAPAGLSMAMHVHAYARIHPRLDSGWPGRRFGWLVGYATSTVRGGGAPNRRALGRAWPLRCTIPMNQRRSWCIASVAIAISDDIEQPCVLGRKCSERRL